LPLNIKGLIPGSQERAFYLTGQGCSAIPPRAGQMDFL
jgi:hypothetical protein